MDGLENKQLMREIRLAAMTLLARREQAYKELVVKLLKKFDDLVQIEQQLDYLVSEGLQSDQRFVEMYIQSKVVKLQGPMRIRNELLSKGVSDNLVDDGLREADVDWFDVARRLVARKYGEHSVSDIGAKEKAKRIRFLQYRGFSMDEIVAVLNNSD
ncbi:regulatory protein RecX [Agaribacterium sp. ZY112]|uniref:regulatory protein RecX n=1 Tax=Agaribacterium sp. ZY112 TaxID=3233574 RepID=UPI003525AFF9